jgi:hypothetical protein
MEAGESLTTHLMGELRKLSLAVIKQNKLIKKRAGKWGEYKFR